MAMEYFCYFHSYGKKTERLSDQELGRLVRALCVYSETGERQELTGRESLAFDFMAEDIDRAKKAYKKKCDTNRHNVERRYTTVDDGNERIPSPTKSTKDKNKQKEKENQKEYTGDIPPESPPAFDRFWAAYPKKAGKGAAQAAFRRITGVPVDVMLFAIEQQRHSRQWQEDNGRFIPNPATWLNQRRWEDEPGEPQSSGNIFADMAREGVFEDESFGSL